MSYGKLIDIEDFKKAALYLASHLPSFHNQRLFTLNLYEDQKKPTEYDDKSCFVLSKFEIPKDK